MNAWNDLITAQTAGDFCTHWLRVLTDNMPNWVSAGVLLQANSEQGRAFSPIALLPKQQALDPAFNPSIEKLVNTGKPLQEQVQTAQGPVQVCMHPIFLNQTIQGVVFVAFSDLNNKTREVRDITWGLPWLVNLLSQKQFDDQHQQIDQLASLLKTMGTGLRTGPLHEVLFELLFAVRERFNAQRAVLAVRHHQSLRLKVISDSVEHDNRSPLVDKYIAALEECLDQHSPIHAHSPQTSQGEQHLMHTALLNHLQAETVVSIPLFCGTECVGVLALEWKQAHTLSEAENNWFQAFSNLFGAVLKQRLLAEKKWWSRLWGDIQQAWAKLLGPENLVLKTATAIAFIVFVVLTFIPIAYRVTANTVIEGEIQQTLSAPFEGFIDSSLHKAGDIVKQGDILAKLDDRDLKTEQEKASGARDQQTKRLREALANHELSDIQIIHAELAQAEAELDLITQKIERATITAPFDGILISGDLSQQIGSPVELGKKLFEIAPLKSYRVILQVDEREVRHIQEGQQGQLLITGIVSEPLRFQVHKITPVATTENAKNYFRVEAKLEQPIATLLPGMEGVGKVSVGERNLWWILFHSFTDWVRLSIWTWLP